MWRSPVGRCPADSSPSRRAGRGCKTPNIAVRAFRPGTGAAMSGFGEAFRVARRVVAMSPTRRPIGRRAVIVSLALGPALTAALPAFALTDQQELVDESRITFDKLITSVEFGELAGY